MYLYFSILGVVNALPSPFDEEETIFPGIHFSEEYTHGWDDLYVGHNYSGKDKLSANMAKVIEAWLNGGFAPNCNNNILRVLSSYQL
jgi:hypothetical protein